MATIDNTNTNISESSIEDRLRLLFDLQKVSSEIDKLKTLRGELPLEVQDLEDEIAGLETRITNLNSEIKELNDGILAMKNKIKDANLFIKKYEAQQSNVRNNREYESLSKEIEYQNLEIELSEKRIKEFTFDQKEKSEAVDASKEQLKMRKADLKVKKSELAEIVSETQVEEERLKKKGKDIEIQIEERLLSAFRRIRKNARNGLAVVTVARDACGGCFNKIPPQRQLDIQLRKKIIVCEYCGRILVDNAL